MHIVLIGYRGTGKSAVGKKLADKLHMPFYDTDELVERGAGRSIRDMVVEEGWAYFRKRESEIVRKLAHLQRGVVATGGGAVMDEGNCDILKKHGLLIWLRADVLTTVERMRGDETSEERRPSFLHYGTFRETEDVLKERLPVYRGLADFSLDTKDKNIDEIVNAVCGFLHGTGRLFRKESTCREIP
ncbi:MAG: shikimate kinase [Syntrophales bacterium]|jgi:shikimate kinase